MTFEEILAYLTVISFLIALAIIIYQFGKWRQKTETDREEIKHKLNAISEKVEKIPDDLLSKSIDLYRMYEKFQEKLQATKKERLEDE